MTKQRSRSRQQSSDAGVLALAAGIWVAVAGVIFFVLHWPALVGWLLGGSIATLLLYGFDKSQARGGGRRIPERVLWGAALLGGVVGAWAGMFLFRHKTKHSSFFVVNGIASVLYAALVWWFLFRS